MAMVKFDNGSKGGDTHYLYKNWTRALHLIHRVMQWVQSWGSYKCAYKPLADLIEKKPYFVKAVFGN